MYWIRATKDWYTSEHNLYCHLCGAPIFLGEVVYLLIEIDSNNVVKVTKARCVACFNVSFPEKS